jgi:hypothetical protein
VGEPRGGARLAEGPLAALRLGVVRRKEQLLGGDVALEPVVAGAPDHREPAPADLLDE